MIAIVIFGIIFFVAAVIIGVIVGNQNPPTSIDASNNMDGKCEANCAQMRLRRSETCIQKRQVAGLQMDVDRLGSQIAAATAIHVALVAATVAAAFIPVAGPYIAAVIGAAAIAALAVVHALFGEWMAKTSQLNQAKGFEAAALAKEAAARTLVLNSCTQEKAIQCFDSLEAC
jgi:hypothetical protein